MEKNLMKELILNFLLGLGFVFIISPSVLYWFIHSNYERYIWIINGPYPFSYLGGGPFQLFTYAGLLIIGVSLIVIGLVLKKRSK